MHEEALASTSLDPDPRKRIALCLGERQRKAREDDRCGEREAGEALAHAPTLAATARGALT